MPVSEITAEVPFGPEAQVARFVGEPRLKVVALSRESVRSTETTSGTLPFEPVVSIFPCSPLEDPQRAPPF